MQNSRQTDQHVRFRTPEDGFPPSAQFISSPYDLDAHLAKKGSTCWVGSKGALTETCGDEVPNLITHVEKTSAPTADGELTPQVHRALQQQDLLPAIHLVDTGFLDAELLVASRRAYGVDRLGPMRKVQGWQSRAAQGFGVEGFVVDFERHKAICPAGRESIEWVPRVDNRGNDSSSMRFSPSHCSPGPSRPQCTTSRAKHPWWSIAI